MEAAGGLTKAQSEVGKTVAIYMPSLQLPPGKQRKRGVASPTRLAEEKASEVVKAPEVVVVQDADVEATEVVKSTEVAKANVGTLTDSQMEEAIRLALAKPPPRSAVILGPPSGNDASSDGEDDDDGLDDGVEQAGPSIEDPPDPKKVTST